jgi:hypothetical protein
MASLPRRRWLEPIIVTVLFAAITIALTYPWAFNLASLGRTDNHDTQYSIWNVAWVARTIVVDPLNVFDANIFHPHRRTLVYAEANIGAGLLAAPIYWLTRDPFLAHNFVVLLSFVLGGLGAYYLCRYLVGDRRAAFVAAIGFAFVPYLFGHLPHIQLLMTAWLPFSMLAFHRLADRPSAGRGAVLGLAMAAQVLFCAYYGVFLVLAVGVAIVLVAIAYGLLVNRRFWIGVATAAIVSAAVVAPLLWQYMLLSGDLGFNRPLADARPYAARWDMYLSSYAYAHGWMARFTSRSGELLFPGFLPLAFGAAGAYFCWRSGGRARIIMLLYVLIGVMAFWASLGPDGGLYTLLYHVVPGFGLMRAPSRMGIVVALAVTVLAAHGLARLLAAARRPWLVAPALAGLLVLELATPIQLRPVPGFSEGYRVLATLPAGPLLELPVSSHQARVNRVRYMLASTVHWMPIVVAYSDYTPPEFLDAVPVLAQFPSRQSFARLEQYGVRYVIFHLDAYVHQKDALNARLAEYGSYLRRVYADERMLLYEIVAYPGSN